MARYTFRKTDSGETKEFEISYSDYDTRKAELSKEGWERVLIPVTVKDSGSGRD